MFEYAGKPIYNWMPVVEPDFGQERFIAEDPYKIMEKGAINKVPLIIGITQYEFQYVAYCTYYSMHLLMYAFTWKRNVTN